MTRCAGRCSRSRPSVTTPKALWKLGVAPLPGFLSSRVLGFSWSRAPSIIARRCGCRCSSGYVRRTWWGILGGCGPGRCRRRRLATSATLEPAVIARAADWTGDLLDMADAETFVNGAAARRVPGSAGGWRLASPRLAQASRTVGGSARKRAAHGGRPGTRSASGGMRRSRRSTAKRKRERDQSSDGRVRGSERMREHGLSGGDHGSESRMSGGDGGGYHHVRGRGSRVSRV